jgi:uncharacterized protein
LKKILSAITVFTVLFIFSETVQLQDNKTAVKITQYVTDETGTLTAGELSELRSRLKSFEDSTSNQIVAVIIKSLQGTPIEMLSYDLAEKNGIGQKGKSNGVLLLIAMEERQLRIEVGYGLEGALPDALCGRIIEDEIKPEFRKGNYYEGISNGIDAIIKATKGEYKPEKSGKGLGGCIGPGLFVIIIIVFIFVMIAIEIIKGIFGFGRVYSGSKKSKSGWSSGGWWWGGGSSGGFGSGGSFGGFSGGGGSFGGGGASGSW